ncbi:hypothetical protein QVD17_26850 [Tagetes erecta]|uniref:Uncharacterized protein n=1 Tax=Tagetes erecta TaxID=13708 RepID=A0AAD8KAU6_TARER|nr:hypothetical protein QVD17_26850 [Tagetes erecta]
MFKLGCVMSRERSTLNPSTQLITAHWFSGFCFLSLQYDRTLTVQNQPPLVSQSPELSPAGENDRHS